MATPEQLQEVVSDFLTAREAAKAIGVHVRTLKYWKATGYGPDHFYIGKRRFPRLTAQHPKPERRGRPTRHGASETPCRRAAALVP